MKTILMASIFLVGTSMFSQQQTLKVVGKNLTLLNGQEITLRGINYPIIDDGSISFDTASQYEQKIDQAALTGANTIRIPWYSNGTHWRDKPQDGGTPGTVAGYVNDGHLSDLIGYCHEKGMIPILELHNLTCSNDWNAFNTIGMDFWTSEPMLSLIELHKGYLIINLANEFGSARWTDNTAANLAIFQDNYDAAIADLRDLGVDVPIMIDAPDCGQSSTELLSIAEEMSDSDPQHNLIFSSHAYWFGYAQTEALVIEKLDEAEDTDACYVLGEVASTQDVDSCGNASLADLYPVILSEACSRNIGWLGWTYTLDCSLPREMTTNGNFNTLTDYGNDLVYNTTYGLLSTGDCKAAQLSTNQIISTELRFYPNPSQSNIAFSNYQAIKKATLTDLSGRQVMQVENDFSNIDISALQNGNYLIKVETKDKAIQVFRLMKL